MHHQPLSHLWILPPAALTSPAAFLPVCCPFSPNPQSLTVWETLSYAAALRLPRGMAPAARAARVEAVLAALGLERVRDTIIGSYFLRGVSGGERKRVSIGHELLINPSLLLLDEPTSGLDSTTALHLLVTLRALARGGRAVATTIHQPSSRLYQQLDNLMLLADGHVAYSGRADAVVAWFGALGFPLPYGVNVADFLLDLAQGEVAGGQPARLLNAAPTAAAAAAPLYAADGKHRGDADGADGLQDVARRGDTAGRAGDAAAAAHPSSLLPISGPAAVRALYSSYETWARGQGRGAAAWDGSPGQDAVLRLALEPPPPRRGRRAGVPAGSATGGSFLERSLTKAGSFLGLDGSEAGGRRGRGPLICSEDDSDDDWGGFTSGSDAPAELGRGLTRVWSRSGSALGQALGASGGAAGVGGLLSRTAVAMGVADRGGASFVTQLVVLTQRCIKVRQHAVRRVCVAVVALFCLPLTPPPLPSPQNHHHAACCVHTVMSCAVLLSPLLLLQVKRFESLSGQRFLQGVAVAALTGLFWWQRGSGDTLLAASDIVGLLFFELLFPAFTALFSALFTFPNDYRMLLKERASGM